MNNSRPRTLVDLLKGATRARADQEVIRYKQDKQWTGLSGQALFDRVRHVALGLYDFGIRKGDRVAILAESGPLWSISDYAILSNGAVNVPIYPTQPPHQVEYILKESAPKLLFISSARQMKRVETILKRFPDLTLAPFQTNVSGERIIPFSSLEQRGAEVAAAHPELYDRIASDVQPTDLASIIYTSGTTGEPKGAMLTHDNIAFNAYASGTFLDIEPGGVMLSFLPMSHIFERMVLYLCLHFGVQINYAGGIETVAHDMLDVRPTLMSTVPRLLEKVYARMQKNASDKGGLSKRLFNWSLGVARRLGVVYSRGERVPPLLDLQREVADRLVFHKIREALGGRIQRMVSGGAALPAEMTLVFNGAGVPVLQGYGLTETAPVIAVNTLTHNRIGAVGRALAGVEVHIAEDGEILTRGPHVFQGYFNKSEETAVSFTDEPDLKSRWFKTGDIGYIDKDGYIFITDRKKDLIKTSAGKYVAPQMIEGLLGQSEYVEQAVIVGDKRKYVSALIVPDFERLRAWAKAQGVEGKDKSALVEDRRVFDLIKSEVTRLTRDLADYEKVKRIGLLADEFTIDGGELTPTLKVRRRVVEQKYSGLIESLYTGGD
ncbi:MAG: AMP-dependent synthetase/ligase [Blastocatellia bacterium]